eukprot:TRINITY_DN31601_c0_g1_i1.p1 TRINITY_DN31601_c0_g1~~TRINITY_DN31601_c0_g1_i1.p1  ORF type:complete len:270 (-),score=16.59 TRINITY_DN31601_c0_g1_i1:94-903(-)
MLLSSRIIVHPIASIILWIFLRDHFAVPDSLDITTSHEGRRLEVDTNLILTRWFSSMAISLSVWIIVAYLYRSNVVRKREAYPLPEQVPHEYNLSSWGSFRYGLFEFDCMYCFFGFCCVPCRLSDTYREANVGGYWGYINVFAVTYIAGEALHLPIVFHAWHNGVHFLEEFGYFAFFIANMAQALWLAKRRQKFRKRFGGSEDTHFTMDFLRFWCCSCCVVVQDAKQLDGASSTRVGFGSNLCCKLKKHTWPGRTKEEMVGHPVCVQKE